jgi:hypothetical protein
LASVRFRKLVHYTVHVTRLSRSIKKNPGSFHRFSFLLTQLRKMRADILIDQRKPGNIQYYKQKSRDRYKPAETGVR